MTRVVRGADGREWTLRSTMEWRSPATSDDFEHDVSVGNAAAVVLMLMVLALATALVLWTPDDVVVPPWVMLVIVLVVLFFPARWTLRRPWTVVAETGDDSVGDPVEKWVGTVRGLFTVRGQMARVEKNIKTDSEPGLEGPLQPVV